MSNPLCSHRIVREYAGPHATESIVDKLAQIVRASGEASVIKIDDIVYAVKPTYRRDLDCVLIDEGRREDWNADIPGPMCDPLHLKVPA